MKEKSTPGQILSILTGDPIDGLFFERHRNTRARVLSWGIHVLVLALLCLSAALPDRPPVRPDAQRLVFLVEPGPGGGGGGSDERSPEPPSVQKIQGEDHARLAIDVDDTETRVSEDEKKPEPEEPEEEPEEKTVKVEAPVVAQAIGSAGDNGSGKGIGEGEGSGIGEGHGGGFGGGAYRLGSGIEPPSIRRQVSPRYSGEALTRKIQGIVVLEVVILRDGTVGSVRVIRSLDPRLDLKAMEAVRQWLFVPGKFRGIAVDVIADIQVDFTLL